MRVKAQTIDTTKQMIGKTLASLGPHGGMDFQFHPGANLLVVTGAQNDINVARIIINAMIEKPPGDSNLASDQVRRIELMRAQLQDQENMIRQMAVQNGQIEAENIQVKAKLQALEKAASGSKPTP